VNIRTVIELNFGGPGSGCNPDAGKCGRPEGSGSPNKPVLDPRKHNKEYQALEKQYDRTMKVVNSTPYGPKYKAALDESIRISDKLSEIRKPFTDQEHKKFQEKENRKLSKLAVKQNLSVSDLKLKEDFAFEWSGDDVESVAKKYEKNKQLNNLIRPIGGALYRGLSTISSKQYQAIKEKFVIGKIIKSKLASFSKSKSVAEDHASDRESYIGDHNVPVAYGIVLLEVQNAKGIDISKISRHTAEAEVVSRGKYKVLSVKETKQKGTFSGVRVTHVKLKQIK